MKLFILLTALVGAVSVQSSFVDYCQSMYASQSLSPQEALDCSSQFFNEFYMFMTDFAANVPIQCYQTNCASCMMDPHTCDSCYAGYWLDAAGQCIADSGYGCNDPYCESCPMDPYTCEVCYFGFQMDTMGFCYEESDPDQFYSHDIYSCYDPACSMCNTDPNICDQCTHGYLLDDTIHACIACGPNCDYCSSPGSCDYCYQGFYMKTDFYGMQHCQACDQAHCMGCSESGPDMQLVCDYCQRGYHLNSQGQCEACTVANCADCYGDAAVCDWCQDGYRIDYDEFQNAICQQCQDPHCGTCYDSLYYCDWCMPGYRLNHDDPTMAPFCEACNDTFCGSCYNDIYTCDYCQGGNLNDHGQCEPCPASNCLHCSPGHTFACDHCAEGFYFDSVVNDCLRWEDAAATSVALVNNGYSCNVDYCEWCGMQPDVCDHCIYGFVLDHSSNTCTPCPYGCEMCTDQYTCDWCRPGHYLNPNQQCEACVDPGCQNCHGGATYCDWCFDGYAEDGVGGCQACADPNCRSCHSGPEICDWCAEGYGTNHTTGQCHACTEPGCGSCQNQDWCEHCLQGYRTAHNDVGMAVCEPCNDRLCGGCHSSPDFCDWCVGGWLDLTTHTCISCGVYNCEYCEPGSDMMCQQCTFGYYFDAAALACVPHPNGYSGQFPM